MEKHIKYSYFKFLTLQFQLNELHSVLGRKRYFHAEGIDEQTGKVYWLPRFLGELHPPAGLAFVEDIHHFVNSIETEHKLNPSSLSSSKPTSLMQSKSQASTGRDANRLQIWSDPFYFLEKRKGDIKDHAILLVND